MHKKYIRYTISGIEWLNFSRPASHIVDKKQFEKWIDKELAKYNAKDVRNTKDADFLSEEDRMIFKLKFG